jgi:hypothetical protein
VSNSSRHRTTIDLRGMEDRLQAFATARRLTIAATVRRALDALLADVGEPGDGMPVIADRADDGPLVKVTLRLPALHALLLGRRARKADVSQGDYVAGLIEGTPLAPRMPDHGDVVAALSRSTSSLAALSVDLHAVTRLLRCGAAGDFARYEASLAGLAIAVGEHVRLASQLIAEVTAHSRRPARHRARNAGRGMTVGPSVDGVLVQWGERLFYPRTRIVKTAPLPRLDAMTRRRAAEIRTRIAATVTRRAQQVMVKVTGGGRGMAAIAAHFRYISKNGRLEMEDDRHMTHEGPDALMDLVGQWRYGGSLIGETSHRREAFNIMLSMPAGTRPDCVGMAAREFAQAELAGHRWLMVLHEHQANPHVHLSVRAEAINGDRLNPLKADLHRWRETFAQKLRGLGLDAEATRQATRGETRHYEALWRIKAKEAMNLTSFTTCSRNLASACQSRVPCWQRVPHQPGPLCLAHCEASTCC